MHAFQLRKIAQEISDQFAQAAATALECEQQLARMEDHPELYSEADLAYARKISEVSDDEANALAEQEHHAWDAYNDASQAEHEEHMNELAQEPLADWEIELMTGEKPSPVNKITDRLDDLEASLRENYAVIGELTVHGEDASEFVEAAKIIKAQISELVMVQSWL